ncbi:MAG: S4 domain-containing protein [Rikenellaceae bacterium]
MGRRIDKYLWCVRLFKTRTDAADAVKNNRVLVNGAVVKPSREVNVGDVLSVKRPPVLYSYKILDLVGNRQPAKNVPIYILDITSDEERLKGEMARMQSVGIRDRGAGRPTKRERRTLDDFLNAEE